MHDKFSWPFNRGIKQNKITLGTAKSPQAKAIAIE